MKKTKRYFIEVKETAWGFQPKEIEDSEGGWVLYSDYAKTQVQFQARVKQLKAQVKELTDKLKELEDEGIRKRCEPSQAI